MKDTDSANKLVFDQLESSYKIEDLKLMPLKPTSHKGLNIVVNKQRDRQHGHGTDQILEFGDEKDVISVFLDENNHLHWSKYPALVFDSVRHENNHGTRWLHSSHIDYAHHKFNINDDGKISLKSHPNWVLGCSDD